MSSAPPTDDPADDLQSEDTAAERGTVVSPDAASADDIESDQETIPATEQPPAAPEPVGPRVIIGVPKESDALEKRVGLIPDTVKKLVADGHTVLIESGAGASAFFADEDYVAVGGEIVKGPGGVFERADLIAKVQKPNDEELAQLRRGQALIAFLQPMTNLDLVKALQDKGAIAFSMDAIPRISRAQYMDALSSMATIAGYKAVLMAADTLPKFMPLLSTAAGNIPPAKVLVIGAGVAGLQAIATARRLGAVVEAYDTRPAVKEQVQSLGARFVEINTGASDTQTAAGYAREATAEELAAQQTELAKRSVRSDAIITTAAVPGRPAPRLISAETVEAMAPGSVIVDLAAETGGNCELTQPGKVISHNGVTIIGTLNIPSQLPVHASQMYAKNIQNLLGVLLDKSGALTLNMDDEIVAGTIITRGGEVVHAGTRSRMGLE